MVRVENSLMLIRKSSVSLKQNSNGIKCSTGGLGGLIGRVKLNVGGRKHRFVQPLQESRSSQGKSERFNNPVGEPIDESCRPLNVRDQAKDSGCRAGIPWQINKPKIGPANKGNST